MPDITTSITSAIPTKEAMFGSLGGILIWGAVFILVIIVFAVGGIITWWLIRQWQFNKKIQIYEDRNGKCEYVGEDRARELIYNGYGDSVFYLKKRKKYLPRGEIKIGKNRFIYVIRSDGEWINCGIESISYKLNQLGLKPIHPDMRAFKSGMTQLIKTRYEKTSKIKEWAPIIVPLILFVLIGIAFYFIADRIVASQNNLIAMTKAAEGVMEKAGEVLSATNNICSNSGIKVG